MPHGRRLAYLCLQSTRPGQASHAHVQEVVAGLERLGWEVVVFEPSPGPADARGLGGRGVEFLRVQWRLWRRRGEFDVLYVRAHPGALPLSLAARAARLPVVQEVNGPWSDFVAAWPQLRWVDPLGAWMLRTVVRTASAVAAVTPQLAEQARGWGQRRTAVVPNAANTALFRPDVPLRAPSERPYAVFVGAFSPWQGIGTLLRAVESAHWPEGVDLVLAGGGGQQSAVEEAARRLPRVRYLGPLPYEEVPGVLAGALAGLSPKEAEAHRATGLSPLKLFEALACGVPVVVSDLPGQADFVRRHQCGVVVPPDDSDALARAVSALHIDREMRVTLGRRGRAAVEYDHSWSRRVEQVARLLEEVVARSRGQV